MGWMGYGIYDGDGTQTWHLDFCKWARLYQGDDPDLEWQETHLLMKGTKLNNEERQNFLKNINLVLKKMPKVRYWDEDNAIEWQMLLALFKDNKMPVPKIVLENGLEATEYLMLDHAADFNNVGLRRRNLKNFIKKCRKLKVL